MQASLATFRSSLQVIGSLGLLTVRNIKTERSLLHNNLTTESSMPLLTQEMYRADII